MKEYTIIYKNKPSEVVAAAGRLDLIKIQFDGDENRFKQDVKKLVWDELSMQCVLDIASDQINAQLSTADINPYGWRNA
ncbi:hypothetical protein [Ekhidna sp.]|uniref:hypothetical protein n=1 Tax=Ekhidna sp. TaxID=2608089 RepID=UPI003296C067